jgi:hypothetical protein
MINQKKNIVKFIDKIASKISSGSGNLDRTNK